MAKGTFYVDTGGDSKTTLVFIHAYPFSLEMWKKQIEALSPHCRCIAYDVRGFGKSDVGDGQYTMDLFAEDLQALLDHLKIEKTILCGLSMGGYIALRFKQRFSERVSAFILANTRAESDADEGKIKRAQTMTLIKTKGLTAVVDDFLKGVFTPESHEKRPELIAEAKKIILANSVIGVCGSLLAMAARTNTTSALSENVVPTLIISDHGDKLIPFAVSEAMQKACPGSKLVTIPNAGHMSNFENPEAFNSAVLEFLTYSKTLQGD